MLLIKNLMNLLINLSIKDQTELEEFDYENCLIKGKIIEALISNKNKYFFKLFNHLDEKNLAKRVRFFFMKRFILHYYNFFSYDNLK